MKKFFCAVFLSFLAICVLPSCSKDSPDEDKIKSLIVGRWRSSTVDGIPIDTDSMKVCYFATGDIYYQTSFQEQNWNKRTQWNYYVDGTTLGYLNPDNGDVYLESVKSISHDKYTSVNSYWKLDPDAVDTRLTEYVHVDEDYSDIIVGLWEMTEMVSEKPHDSSFRIECFEDGTFDYYTKDKKGNWIFEDEYLNEYVVLGDMLYSRWIVSYGGEEYRDTYYIEYCNDSEMRVSALATKPDGSYSISFIKYRRAQW